MEIGNDRCDCLRWKGLFVQTEGDPTVQPSNDRAFWCLQTQIPIGPDGKPVDEFECNPSRACYKPL